MFSFFAAAASVWFCACADEDADEDAAEDAEDAEDAEEEEGDASSDVEDAGVGADTSCCSVAAASGLGLPRVTTSAYVGVRSTGRLTSCAGALAASMYGLSQYGGKMPGSKRGEVGALEYSRPSEACILTDSFVV